MEADAATMVVSPLCQPCMNSRFSGILSAAPARLIVITAFGRATALDSAWNTRNSSAAGKPAAVAQW